MDPLAPTAPTWKRLLLALALPALAALPVAALPSGTCPDLARVSSATDVALAPTGLSFTVGWLEADARVDLLSCEGRWAQVEQEGAEPGWVRLALLVPMQAAASTATTPRASQETGPLVRDLLPASLAGVRATPLPEPAGSVQPQRALLLREEPRWSSPVAGRSPAGQLIAVLSSSESGWSLVDAGLDRPVWVVTAALHAPPLSARR